MSGASSGDRQALLQAMLQRLKLQADLQGGSLPASPAAPHQQTPGPYSRTAHNGSGIALVGSPGMGRGGRSWDSREEFRNPVLDSNLDTSGTGAKVNGERGLVHGPLSDNRQETTILNLATAFSSTSCKDNTADSWVEGRGSRPTVSSSAVSGGLFPVHTQKEAEGTSSARTNGGKEGNDISAIEESVIDDAMSGAVGDDGSLAGNPTSASQYHRSSHSSDPGGLAGSGALLSPIGSLTRDTSPSTHQGSSPWLSARPLKGQSPGRGEPPAAHKGKPGPLALSHTGGTGPNTAGSPVAPLQRDRASGSRTKRWTQKIKEKFRERGGSLKKRKKEEGKEEVKVEEEGKISTHNEYHNTNVISSAPSSTVEPTSQPTDPVSTDVEDSTVDMRSNDFNIGLGSFSLLEEIKTGQYWATFLSPALSEGSTYQRPAQQHAGQSQNAAVTGLQENNQSSGGVDLLGNPVVAVMATSPAYLPVPVTMDTSEPDGSGVVMEHEARAEPMEQHGQSEPSEEPGPTPGGGPQVHSHFINNAGLVNNTILLSQIRSRKRVHRRSLERTGSGGTAGGGGEGRRASGGRGASGDEAPSSSASASGPVAVTTEEGTSLLYLYPFKARQTPSLPAPREFVPKGVLKHTQCKGTESTVSMETAAKKRRMEVGRRVRFSEEVVAIAPVVFDISMGSDSDLDSPPEDSETEEEPGGGAKEGDGAPPPPPPPPHPGPTPAPLPARLDTSTEEKVWEKK
ncbi:uncharacterized protein LOC115551909 [Gadus morhua]|uniref:uncharacterized protein LOC115551909 n=1 Tax=Gadus morhua TaxID=8049 RepID=UPI0011B4BDD3|nr:uncharacterized protein LOC115551909 [Gadus morhua]